LLIQAHKLHLQFLIMFSLFNFLSIFTGRPADPICPYVRTPMYGALQKYPYIISFTWFLEPRRVYPLPPSDSRLVEPFLHDASCAQQTDRCCLSCCGQRLMYTFIRNDCRNIQNQVEHKMYRKSHAYTKHRVT